MKARESQPLHPTTKYQHLRVPMKEPAKEQDPTQAPAPAKKVAKREVKTPNGNPHRSLDLVARPRSRKSNREGI